MNELMPNMNFLAIFPEGRREGKNGERPKGRVGEGQQEG
jgi:hypothetical protein